MDISRRLFLKFASASVTVVSLASVIPLTSTAPRALLSNQKAINAAFLQTYERKQHLMFRRIGRPLSETVRGQ